MPEAMSSNSESNSDRNTLTEAVNLVEQYNLSPAKADEILASRYIFTDKNKLKSRVCQFIFLTVLRNKPLIESAIAAFAKRKPRSRLFALLECAAAEMVENPSKNYPKIVDYHVEYAKNALSKGEAKFCNAVLRRVGEYIEVFKSAADTFEKKCILYGHPQWLADRWKKYFGEETALEIMRLNSLPSKVVLRKCFGAENSEEFAGLADVLKPLQNFDGFYELARGAFGRIEPLLKDGKIYIQDASTGIAANMLSPKAGMKVLDLCAAPGGKSRLLADLMKSDAAKNPQTFPPLSESVLVSVDCGQKRMNRLRENFAAESALKNFQIDCDFLKEDLSSALKAAGAPEKFDAIFLDAPCSNTGVLGRRPDARYRITPADISFCATLQLSMLLKAKDFLKDGGKIAYSTCSIDEEENEGVANRFIGQNPEFSSFGKTNLPTPESDGCGAFLLSRTK